MEKIEDSLPNETIHYQYYYYDRVYNRALNIKLSPVSVGTKFSFSNPIENKLFVECILNEYPEGNFLFNNKKYKVQINRKHMPGIFDSLNTKINILKINNMNPEKGEQSNIYNVIGDTISLNDFRYRFSSISIFGDILSLAYVGKGPAIYGIDSGKIAYNIKTQDLFNNKFELTDLKGKYVLIDFWGSWCVPCIYSITDLVAISNKFKDKVQLVSIADDDPGNVAAIKKIIKDKGMNWIHLFQDKTNPSKEAIIDQYKVDAFPTQILIDPQGKIILRSTGDDMGPIIMERLNTLVPSLNTVE